MYIIASVFVMLFGVLLYKRSRQIQALKSTINNLECQVCDFKCKIEALENNKNALQIKCSRKEFCDDAFFVSEEAKAIFALLYTDGKVRADLLGISESMYESLSEAKKWRSKYIHLVHSDHSDHPLAKEATSKIYNIYARMKKYAK